ncbi:phytanoyl-CoA dioxygenase family protein [Streptomyces canus]|jgi:ectoine hydroxylase|uniref:phytanoyl-CoA dioxygenase family protein n=1 Tax=Streptomyces canus TaxID=58343 RepID=UPI0036E058A5
MKQVEERVQLSPDQIAQYRENGFLVLNSLFDPTETEALSDAFDADCLTPGPQRILEENGEAVRAVYASHERRHEFATLVRTPRLLGPARQLMSDDLYVYQFKINAKPAFGGDKWAWHQDFLAWKLADNLAAPRQVNIGVFLDEVTEFNGPLIFLPGSHRSGLLRDFRNDAARSVQHLDPDDIALRPEQMSALVDRHGMVSPKGPAGSVILFDPEVVHGSAPNMSPFPRRLLIATYNDVANAPVPLGEPRPSYVVGRDTTPLRFSDDPIDLRVGGAV